LQGRLEAGSESYSYALFIMSDAALEGVDDAGGFDVGEYPDVVVVNVSGVMELPSVHFDAYGDAYGEQRFQGLRITPLDR
jgi:hypothetical protein